MIGTGRFSTVFTRAPTSLPSTRRTHSRGWNFGHYPFSQTKAQFTETETMDSVKNLSGVSLKIHLNIFLSAMHRSSKLSLSSECPA